MHKRLRACVGGALLLTLPGIATASPDHYIYDADVELFDDFDGDGFFRFLSVRVDADTLSDGAWVYAELYLSPDGTNWEHYYSTGDFWISGATGNDEYFVETELVSGYPTGYYDLLVELYDADLGTFSDEFGPLQSDGMSLLPLEDATRDPEPVEITIVEGGGGSFSWLWLPALLLGGRGLRAGNRSPGSRLLR
ncbi:MAG TPA: choice-of-anchor H family protein [Gammaproteobacteria bacterium]|jgi:hypothetical protein